MTDEATTVVVGGAALTFDTGRMAGAAAMELRTLEALTTQRGLGWFRSAVQLATQLLPCRTKDTTCGVAREIAVVMTTRCPGDM